jgi:hypothetical protein
VQCAPGGHYRHDDSRKSDLVTADGWTIPQACEQFKQQGMPVEERHLRAIIRHLPGLNPVGETKSGPTGGRGHPLYDIGSLQRLHSALAPWLTTRQHDPT